MKYTDEDLERVHRHANVDDGTLESGAQLIADVRHETREATIRECAEVAAVYAKRMEAVVASRLGVKKPALVAECKADAGASIAADIQALLTPPSAPAEPKCKVCGEAPGHHRHNKYLSLYHTYRPEEPGHG